MTIEQAKKKQFVEEFGEFLSRYIYDIEALEYHALGETYSEEVIITGPGCNKTVNVSMDSIPALVRDVMRWI